MLEISSIETDGMFSLLKLVVTAGFICFEGAGLTWVGVGVISVSSSREGFSNSSLFPKNEKDSHAAPIKNRRDKRVVSRFDICKIQEIKDI